MMTMARKSRTRATSRPSHVNKRAADLQQAPLLIHFPFQSYHLEARRFFCRIWSTCEGQGVATEVCYQWGNFILSPSFFGLNVSTKCCYLSCLQDFQFRPPIKIWARNELLNRKKKKKLAVFLETESKYFSCIL